MRGTVFYKMSGSGNDFVVLDARTTKPGNWSEEDIVQICDRRMGVGADGIVFLGPEGPGAELRMVYINNDGGRVDLCGNAALCCTRLAHFLEMTAGPTTSLHTDAGILATRYHGGNVASIQLPDLPMPVPVDLPLEEGEEKVLLCAVGVPHLVVLTSAADRVDIMTRGAALRCHPVLGPDGANVNFVSPGDGDGDWRIRTFERGIEGETLACGTGTVAAAASVAAWGLGTLPLGFVTSRGISLEVEGSISGSTLRQCWLRGEGRLVFTGILS